VTAHARHCSSCATPLPEAAQFCFACGTPVENASPNPSVAPQSTTAVALQSALGGDYLVRRLLGQGGFAEVYAAWDVRLKREVAVKVLRPELGFSSVSLDRFRREAEAAAPLRHPNIIPVFAVGEREGLAYIIMPLIQGETLRERLDREGRLPIGEARRILLETAAALAAAHEIGLIHRDIKPENIMLEGKERRALLMDFGIAKPAISGGERLTETGLVVGTPYYMSPEQAAGDRQLDHRADQYSLAAVGYEMLAGQLLFEGDSAHKVLHQQLTARPTRLDTLVDIPSPFAAVIERALAKDPADRFASMAEMSTALSDLELTPDSGVSASSDEPSRLPAPPAVGLSVAAVLGVLIFLALYPMNHPEAGTFTGVRREVAESVATALFARQGAVGAFDRSTSVGLIRSDSSPIFLTDGRTLMMRALGPKAAVEWARHQLPFWEFRVRWSDPGRGERWEGGVATDYRVVEFSSAGSARPPSDTIPVDSARAIAQTFLRTVGLELSHLLPADRRDLDRGAAHEFVWEDPAGRVSAHDTARAAAGIVRAAVTVRGNRVTGFRRYLHPLGPAEEVPAAGLRSSVGLTSYLALTLVVILLLGRSLARKGSSQFRGKEVFHLALLVASVRLLAGLNRWPDIRFELVHFEFGIIAFSVIAPTAFYLLTTLTLGLLGEHLARDGLAPNIDGVVPLLRGEFFRPAIVRGGLWGTAIGLVALGLGALTDLGAGAWDSSWQPHFDAPTVIFNTLSPSADLAAGAVVESLRSAALLLVIVSIAHRLLRRLPLTILACGAAGALLGWSGDHWLAAAVLGLFWGWGFLRLGLLSCVVGLFVANVGNSGMELVTSGGGNRMAIAVTAMVLLLLPGALALWFRRALSGPPSARSDARQVPLAV
jgi:tRNA A-37 threonylcarbamoyl transferase component Bud32